MPVLDILEKYLKPQTKEELYILSLMAIILESMQTLALIPVNYLKKNWMDLINFSILSFIYSKVYEVSGFEHTVIILLCAVVISANRKAK